MVDEIKRHIIVVVSVQETKLLGSKKLKGINTIFFKSGRKNRRLGTGFIIPKQFKYRL